MTDPIADMLTRIRNASAIKKPEVILPLSRVKFEIAKILENEGYLAGVEKTEGPKPSLKLEAGDLLVRRYMISAATGTGTALQLLQLISSLHLLQ